MSQYTCDICSNTFARSDIRFHAASTMQRAILSGLNPWETPGIKMSAVSRGVGNVFGLGSAEIYAHWRQRALADTTDWGLCQVCTQVVNRLSAPAAVPTIPSPRLDYAAALRTALEVSGPRIDAGVAEFEAQIASYPETAEKRFWLGAAFLTAAGAEESATFLDRAIESFQRALQLDPKHKNSYAKLLGAYMSKGDDDHVRETAMCWAKVDPDLPPEARRWLHEQDATDRAESGTVSESPRRPSQLSKLLRRRRKKWWQFWR